MSKVDELKELLELQQGRYDRAIRLVSLAYAKVEATEEYASYRIQKDHLAEVAKEKDAVEQELKEAEYEEGISSLKKQGFEARTGHEVGSYYEEVEHLRWVVVPSRCRKLTRLSEVKDKSLRCQWEVLENYTTEAISEADVYDTWLSEGEEVIGYGETEEEAWSGALQADEEDVVGALNYLTW